MLRFKCIDVLTLLSVPGVTNTEKNFDLALQHSKEKLLHSKVRGPSRRKREFMPDEKKDNMYWEKRRKNNEAAKRSREKRRLNDFAMESQLAALSEENAILRTELLSLNWAALLQHNCSWSLCRCSCMGPTRPHSCWVSMSQLHLAALLRN
uniref:BZIP domain-containing protein n=1 Tax=Cairina moschata TaxID=8855 RepID=A0A8C3BNA6_CAIMO